MPCRWKCRKNCDSANKDRNHGEVLHGTRDLQSEQDIWASSHHRKTGGIKGRTEQVTGMPQVDLHTASPLIWQGAILQTSPQIALQQLSKNSSPRGGTLCGQFHGIIPPLQVARRNGVCPREGTLCGLSHGTIPPLQGGTLRGGR